jgi:hypothetical protein
VKITTSVSMAVIVLGLLIPATALGSKPGSGSGCTTSEVNVTSTLFDTDSTGVPFQLQSDGKGSYTTETISRTDSDVSALQSGTCDWILSLSSSQPRTMKLTLAYPASNNNPPPPFIGPQNIASYIISKCEKNPLNNGISYGTMTYNGQILQCGFSVAFDFNGNSYGVRFNPNAWAGTTWAQVTCTGASGAPAQCNTWTVTPVPLSLGGAVNNVTGQVSAIGVLVQVTQPFTETPLGLYYVDFSSVITKP